MKTNGLSKKERLCNVKAIGTLVAKGRYVSHGSLRCCYLLTDSAEEQNICRIVVSVPKRLFKRAVKRNLLKRRIREAYRLQKSLLESCNADLMFVYCSKEVASFQDIYSDMTVLLKRIAQK